VYSPRPGRATAANTYLDKLMKTFKRTPKPGIALWEVPHLYKGVWKRRGNPAEQASCQLANPTYVT